MRNQSDARRNAILLARAEIDRKPIYLDTETTGLDPTDQIVEICIADDSGQVLVDSLVKPTSSIPFSARLIHGITDEMVQTAPAWRELWPQIEAVLTDRRIAIYNAEFDLRLMKQTHRQHHMPWQSQSLSSFCIMQLYAQFYGEWDSYHGSYRWQNLDRAIQQCAITGLGARAHRARPDTLAARAILHYMAEWPRVPGR